MGDDFIRLGKGISGVVGYYDDFPNCCCKIYNLELDERKLSNDEQEYIFFLANNRTPSPPISLSVDELDTIDNVVDSYRRELKILRKLKNETSIVQLYENEEILNMCLSAELRLTIVMEKLETNLFHWLNMNSPLSYNTIINFAQQILDGLEAIQRAGIVHLDIKPSNILVSFSKVLKICDFGNATEDIPNTFNIVTIEYRPIEVFLELPYWDFFMVKKIDIWSAGCVFYELAFNKRLINTHETINYRYVKNKMDTLHLCYSNAITDIGKFIEKIVLKMICERLERQSIKKIKELLSLL